MYNWKSNKLTALISLGHGLGGYDTDLCHEGYDDFCYSPYGSNYVGHRNLHDTRYNNGHYSNMHYDIDSFPHFVGNVLSNADAMKLGFNQAYLKKLGFDGRVWHHRHHYGPHHVHTGGHVWLGGHGSLGGHVGNGMLMTFYIAYGFRAVLYSNLIKLSSSEVLHGHAFSMLPLQYPLIIRCFNGTADLRIYK